MRKVKTIAAALSRTNSPVSEPTRLADVLTGDSLENVVAALGTSRDKRSYSNYTTARLMTRYDLDNMYQGSWLSKRIVNSVPDGITKKWRRFVFADDDSNPSIELLRNAEKQYRIKEKFNNAIRWGRLYGAGFLILGMNDVKNPEDMKKPLNVSNVKKGDLRYIHVVDRWRVAPSGQRDTDLESPNFGEPLCYLLAESSVEIHWSRMIKFDGEKLPYFPWLANGMFHDSVLRHTYESLINYDTMSASLASMLFEANVDVVQSEGLTELLSTKTGEAKLTKRFQLASMMKSFNRMLVLDSNEKYEKKSNTFSGLDKLWQQAMTDVSAASGLPISILFGVQSGGLDSGGDDDLRNWYDLVSTVQSAEVEPKLDYFDEVFTRSVLGSKPDNYSSQWEALWQMDDSDQATIEYNRAQRDHIYITDGVVTEGLVASELKARGTYRTMSDEDVELAQELGEEVDEAQSAGRQSAIDGTNDATPNDPSGSGKQLTQTTKKDNKKKPVEK